MSISAILPGVASRRHQFTQTLDLLSELVRRDLVLRYKRSVLGILWSLVNPLSQLLVLALIFGYVLPLGIPDYVLFLFTGLLVWNWFSSSISSACNAIVENRQLIRLPNFPVPVLPTITVLTNLIHLLLAFPIVGLLILASGRALSIAVLALPLVILIQYLLIQSIAFLVAALHVQYRDTQHLVGVILTLAFYLSPVFYEPSSVPQRLRMLYDLNPMVPLLSAYRAILIRGVFPDWVALGALAGLLSLLLFVCFVIFLRSSQHFVEEL